MNLIFDFDGTIADTLSSTVNILNKFLDKRKLSHTSENELRKNGGMKGLVNIHHVPNVLVPYLVLWGRHELSKEIDNAQTFKGLPEVLQRLSHTNQMGIITSNSKQNVEKFLRKNNLDNYFDFIISDRSLFDKHIKIQKAITKYKLKHQNTVYIGDETRDMEAAKKAKVKAVAVTWGFESKESLTHAKPDKIISKPKDLLII